MKALLGKSIRDSRGLLAALVVLMFAFNWLFVWLSNLIEIGPFGVFLESLPPAFEKMIGVPFKQVLTPTGQIALAYAHPVVILASTLWSVARGSDTVSGEIDRGTMEMLLAQPVRRVHLIVVPALVSTCGAALIAASVLLGTCCGLATVPLRGPVNAADFVPASVNLFAFMVALGGISTLVSSFQSRRWRTIGVVVSIYVVELIIKFVARMAPGMSWLIYLTFLGAFEPQAMILDPNHAWATSLVQDGTLLGLGLASYVGAAVVFSRRDIPAPF